MKSVLFAIVFLSVLPLAYAQNAPLTAPEPVAASNQQPAENTISINENTNIEPLSFPQETLDDNVSGKQSIQAALENTYQQNPTLQAARANLRAVQEQLPQAYSGFKPTVIGDASILATDIAGSNFGGADGSTSKDLALTLNQPLFRGGQTFAQVKAAKAVINAQISALKQIEQDVLLAAATSFMDVLEAQSLLSLSQNNRDLIARQSKETQLRFEVGDLSRTDSSQAQARLARADSNVITSRGALESLQGGFEQIIGYAPNNLAQPDMSFALPRTQAEAVKIAEAQSPVVLISVFNHRAAEEDVDDVFGELLPEVGFNAQWNRTFDPQPGFIPEQTTRSVGLSASIPLYQAGSVRSRVRQAKYTANQRFIEIAETKREIRQRVIASWVNLQGAKAEITARKSEVEAASVARDGVNKEAKFGTRTILDALDSDQELLDAQVALVSAEREMLVAQFTLMSTLGLLTPEVLQIKEAPFSYQNTQKIRPITDFFDLGVDRIGDTP